MTIYTHTGLSAPTLNSTAEFRKWASLVDAMILACGWVQTADTGQSNPATATVPGTTNTAAGFRVYSLDDALAGVAPVLLKYEWGSGGNTTTPVAWLTIGTGSNGAGNLTGILLARSSTASFQSHSTTESPSYASGDGSSLNITMWPTGPGAPLWTLRIERSRTGSGEPTAEALAITLASWGTSIARTIGHGGTPGSSQDAYGTKQGVTIPATINGVMTTQATPSTLSQDGDTAPVFPVMHAAPGVTPWVSANLVAVAPGDAGATALVIANTHGTPRAYRAFPQVANNAQCDVGVAGSASGVAITAQVWAEV